MPRVRQWAFLASGRNWHKQENASAISPLFCKGRRVSASRIIAKDGGDILLFECILVLDTCGVLDPRRRAAGGIQTSPNLRLAAHRHTLVASNHRRIVILERPS